jgi:hypothetical protein
MGYATLIKKHSTGWSGDSSKAKKTKKDDDSDEEKDSGKRRSMRGKKVKKDDDEDEEETSAKKKTPAKKTPTKRKKGKGDDDDDDDDDGGDGGKPKTKCRPVGKLPPPPDVSEIKKQAGLGAQSRRNFALKFGHMIDADKHGKYCFEKMLENEARLCGEYAVFYHSYSLAALLYEVQAAVASVLFRFKSTFASLPRLLKAPYNDIADADELMKAFPKMKGRDHNVQYRSVAICATTTLLGPDPEAPPTSVFLAGYSCGDVSFMGVLENLLDSCYVPKAKVKALAKEMVEVSASVRHQLSFWCMRVFIILTLFALCLFCS